MKLNPTEVRAAYYVLGGYRRAELPQPPSVRALYERLDRIAHTGEVSPTRQETGCDSSGSEHVELVGARYAAAMLGWHGEAGLRRVQRHAADLDGQRIGNRWVFRAETVKQYRDHIEGSAP